MRSLRLLSLIKTYNSVTENGFAVKDEDSKALEQAIQDDERVHYFEGATEALLSAINDDGVDVRGYLAWSKSESASQTVN